MHRLAVVIPSRTQPAQASFLARAIGSIRAQVGLPAHLAIEIRVCVDHGAPVPALPDGDDVQLVEATASGQASALNAGVAHGAADYLAFLEDDDHWHPDRVRYALGALDRAELTSSTQLEVDAAGAVVRINDFPTTSGWLMPHATWDRVGPFDATYRLHLDNDWLGRLGETGLRRAHLVEATAPIDPRLVAQIRPWLDNCLRHGGPHVALHRHASPVPLVTRLVHARSAMSSLERDPAARDISSAEVARITARFGRIPW